MTRGSGRPRPVGRDAAPSPASRSAPSSCAAPSPVGMPCPGGARHVTFQSNPSQILRRRRRQGVMASPGRLVQGDTGGPRTRVSGPRAAGAPERARMTAAPRHAPPPRCRPSSLAKAHCVSHGVATGGRLVTASRADGVEAWLAQWAEGGVSPCGPPAGCDAARGQAGGWQPGDSLRRGQAAGAVYCDADTAPAQLIERGHTWDK